MTFIGQTIGITSSPDLLQSNQTCDSSVNVGDWVRLDPILLVLVKAQADIFANSNVLGLVEVKSSATSCSVRVGGISKPIFTGLDVSTNYFLDPSIAGQMTITVPTGSGQVVLALGQPFDTQRFLVEKKIRLIRA